jgi:pimeloyl-ACP methyl ester carboxylesterase
MASLKNPTVLLVHGAWHTPKHFERVRVFLETAGYRTSCGELPTTGQLPPIGLFEDAQSIRDELKRLIEDEHRNVFVVAHSYGGVVATQATDAEFSRAARAAKGLPGGVLRIVYMCAFLPLLGESVASLFGGSLDPAISIDVRIVNNKREMRLRHT